MINRTYGTRRTKAPFSFLRSLDEINIRADRQSPLLRQSPPSRFIPRTYLARGATVPDLCTRLRCPLQVTHICIPFTNLLRSTTQTPQFVPLSYSKQCRRPSGTESTRKLHPIASGLKPINKLTISYEEWAHRALLGPLALNFAKHENAIKVRGVTFHGAIYYYIGRDT